MENDRKTLIEKYYRVRPNDCDDLIDLEYEKKRIETISLKELENEIRFYQFTQGWD